MRKTNEIRRIVAAFLCLMMLSSNILAEPAATAGEASCEEHAWGEGGFCTICGDKNLVIEKELESETTTEPEKEQEEESLNVPDLMADTACTHENTERANETTSYLSNAAASHTVIVTYDMVCSSCGETVQAGLTEQSEAVHELKTDGSCNFCNYVADINPMQISISNAIEGHDMIVSWSGISNASYYRYTIKNTTTGEYHNQNQKTDATEAVLQGEKVVAGEKYKIWVGAYNVSDKVLCQADTTITAIEYSGSTGGDTCAHVNTVNEVRETVYEYYSEEEHHVITYEDVFCKDCNTVIGEDMKQYGAQHEPDNTGVCEYCGYTVQETQMLTLSVGAAVDGKDMTVSWNAIEGADHYQFNVRDMTTNAPIWGETGRETTNCALTIDAVFMFENHEYKIWVGAFNENDIRICETTAYVTAEAAPANSLNLWYDTPYAGVDLDVGWDALNDVDHYEHSLRDVTSNTLHYNRQKTTHNYLTISGDMLEKEHTYRLWVGAIGADGAEPTGEYQATVTFTVNECLHGSPVKINEEYYRVSISDTHHHVEATYDLQCIYCDEIVEMGISEEYDEEHMLDANGDCTQCKYTAGCPHTETKTVETSSNYLTHDENQHKYVVTYQTVCANAACGKVIVELESETTYYDHEFDGDTCTVCGYTKNTALSVTVTREAASAVLGVQIAATASANGGSGSYAYSWKVACDGETVHEEAYDHRASYIPTKAGKWVFTVTVTDQKTGEKVSASSAEIIVTETACAHEQTEETLIETKYVKASDTQHEIQKTYQISCKSCGVVINSGYIKSDYEAHDYTDGKCVCGISEPGECAHDGDVTTEKVSETIEQHNADKHKVITIYRDICDSCYAVLNAAREHSSLAVHAYVNGVCACGKLEPSDGCDHATTETRSTPVIERNWDDDANTHYVVTDVSITCDCGKISEQKTEKILVAHDFDYVGMEGDHPHKQFKRCDCGVTVYTGKNGYSGSCWTCNPPKQEDDDREDENYYPVISDPDEEAMEDKLQKEKLEELRKNLEEVERLLQETEEILNAKLEYIEAAKDDTYPLNWKYEEIVGKDYDVLLDSVVASLSGHYDAKWDGLTDLIGNIGAKGSEYIYKLATDFENYKTKEQNERERKEMVKETLAEMLDEDIENDVNVWELINQTISSVLLDEKLYDNINTTREFKNQFQELLEDAVNKLTDTKTPKAVEGVAKKLEIVSDIVGYAIETIGIKANSQAEKMALSALATQYGKKIALLDAVENSANSEVVKLACVELREDIFNAANDDFTRIDKEEKTAFDKLTDEIELAFWMYVGEATTGMLEKLGENALGSGSASLGLVKTINSAFRYAGGVSAGHFFGDLMTYYTGETIDARQEVLTRSIVANQLKTELINEFNQGDDSEALYQMSRLYLNSVEKAYEAMEKMFYGTQASLYVEVFNNDDAEEAKKLMEICKKKQEDISETLEMMRNQYEFLE